MLKVTFIICLKTVGKYSELDLGLGMGMGKRMGMGTRIRFGIGSGNSGCALSLADFKTGCCILALDLTPDMCSKYNFVLFHFLGILRVLEY